MSDKNMYERDWLETELDETLEEMLKLEFSDSVMRDDFATAIKKETLKRLII